MILTADKKGRLGSRTLFPPGTAFESSFDAQGRIVLVRLVPAQREPAKARLVRKAGYTMLKSSVAVSREEMLEAIRKEGL
jgi:hypothetical protein